jgi:hypothetical protein
LRLIPKMLLFLLVVFSFSGCGMDKDKAILMAAGSYGDLAVVVSNNGMKPIADRFLTLLNQDITFVIKPEKLFKPEVYMPSERKYAEGFKNIIYLVHLGGGGSVEKLVRGKVSDEAMGQLESGGGGIVQIHDPYSTYQLMIVVASRDRNNLASILRKNSEHIREIIQNSSQERILRRFRYSRLNTPLMNKYWDEFGFMMEIPAVFSQNQIQPGGFQGVEIMQNGPSRGISVSWKEVDNPTELLSDRPALFAIREEMGHKMHDEEIIPSANMWSGARIQGVDGVKLQGAWNSNLFSGGGAFWSYFIPDEARGRLYCVDLLAYAPNREKLQYFRKMDAIVSTFSTTRPQP